MKIISIIVIPSLS